jgi:hypothetical protein
MSIDTKQAFGMKQMSVGLGCFEKVDSANGVNHLP